MVKARKFMLSGMFLLSLVLITGFASANTLVGGKIYNSDFSEVVEGAEISVQCGSETLDTESLSDGAYAVIFDSDNCGLGDKVSVEASKGDLSNEDSSNVYESEEEEGEFVAVVNLNLKVADSSGSRRHSGTWFQCGNTVCDSGETYATCAEDCPETTEEETPTGLLDLSSNPENSDDSLSGETPSSQTVETTNLGITGAVTGERTFWNKNSVPIVLIGLVLFLIIAILCINLISNITKKKTGDGTPEINYSKYE